MPVGEEAEVADAHEAARKHVEEEAAQELVDRQAHQALLVAVSGVSPAEADLAIGEGDQPAVGDADAVGVTIVPTATSSSQPSTPSGERVYTRRFSCA